MRHWCLVREIIKIKTEWRETVKEYYVLLISMQIIKIFKIKIESKLISEKHLKYIDQCNLMLQISEFLITV